jgi:L-malate glycosyltransferase
LRLKRIVREHSIDIIHVNDLYNMLPVALRLFATPVPYVCHVRFLPDRFPKPLIHFWLKLHFRFAEKIIAVSEKVKAQLPLHPKIVVIHNELPIEERYAHALPAPDHFTFLYVSNFIRGKGQIFALKAFSKIHENLDGWRLRFVGGDMGLEKNREYKNELVKTADTLGIGKKVEWVGFTEDVELEYKHGDIVLNFSESESFSITCLEAMYYGRPVIATDCGGPAEIIDHLKTGILVPNRDVLAMTEAMLKLATNADLRQVFGALARSTVKEKFSIQNTSYRLKEVYNAIFATR